MRIGARVRRCFGPLERPVSLIYRSGFVNLGDFADFVASVAHGDRILEVGCGEGALAEQLLRAFPAASVLGIDIADDPGRLFQGEVERARFRSVSTSQLLDEDPDRFDVVVMCDVLHHVASSERPALLLDARSLLVPGGTLVVKDWEPSNTPVHALAYFMDRYVAGERVEFPRRPDLVSLARGVFDERELVAECRIPPWRNNFAIALTSSVPGPSVGSSAGAPSVGTP